MMRKSFCLGLTSSSVVVTSSCSILVVAFLFQFWSMSVAQLVVDDIIIIDFIFAILWRNLKHRGSRLLRLLYHATNVLLEAMKCCFLWQKWIGFFDMNVEKKFSMAYISAGLRFDISSFGTTAGPGLYYGSHRLRIGGFYEHVRMGLSHAWLMQRLDWAPEA